MKLGIVIIGFTNQQGVKRLLHSLDSVDFMGDNDIPLIFSIDYSGDSAVEKIAEKYIWKNGKKIINAYKKNLGLRKHILSCGDYMNQYNLDALVVLEDDIYIAPYAYKYIKAATEYYIFNPQIAGISLYKHEYNINAGHPFGEYHDIGDTFFIQYAMSWGQVWFRDKWNDFAKWYKDNEWEKLNKNVIPDNILQWNNSWLKYHIMYCIDKDLYFVYPRIGLTTDFSDPGAHNKTISTSMQIRLDMGERDWNFNEIDSTLAVYDAFFENCKLKDFLNIPNLVVDLYGAKKIPENAAILLTRKILPYKILKSWGLFLRPIEANVFQDISGEEIFLYDMNVIEQTQIIKRKKSINQYRYFEYDLKGLNIISINSMKYCINKIIQHFKVKLSR